MLSTKVVNLKQIQYFRVILVKQLYTILLVYCGKIFVHYLNNQRHDNLIPKPVISTMQQFNDNVRTTNKGVILSLCSL